MLAQRSGSVMRAPQRSASLAQPRLLALGTRRSVVAKHRAGPLVVRAAVAPSPSSNGSEEQGKFPPLGAFSPSLGVPNTTMAGGMGSQSGLGATLERSRMNFVMPTPVVKGPKLDDGGDGGDIGKNNRNGGGGDGGGGDDDDWFGEEDGDGDGEGGDRARQPGFLRDAIPESYDKFSVGAVFAEWMKTVQDLPAILRQAVQMGLFSSAQLVRFFCVDVRPGVTRAISRHLPPSAARDFVGRLMADPGFVQKMVMEAAFASCASLWYEYRARGERFKEELDLVLINTIGMAAATGATVWLLAPSRSYGSLQKLPWQQMLETLPNCVFDASGPLRSYTKQARAAGFLAKAAELSAVGAVTGAATALLSSAAVAVRRRSDPEWQPSVPVPGVGRSSGGMAAFFALNANARYQLVGGLDRFLFDRTTFLWTATAASCAARLGSNQLGEVSRAWWQGLPDARTLPLPAFLAAGPQLPVTRKVRKKVTKRVPRSSLLQQQQQKEQQPLAAAAAAAVVALPAEAGPLQQLELQAPQLQQPSEQEADEASGEGAQLQHQAAVAGAVQQVELSPAQQEAGQARLLAAAVAAATSEEDDEEDEEDESGGGSEEAAPVTRRRALAAAGRH